MHRKQAKNLTDSYEMLRGTNSEAARAAKVRAETLAPIELREAEAATGAGGHFNF